MEGWIKLHRRTEQHWVWKDPRKAIAWIHLLFRANYEDKKVLIDGEEVLVPRGSFLTSIRKLSGEIPLSIQETRTFLRVLESNTMINTVATHKLTQITVCKYEEYQTNQHSEDPESTQPATSDKEEKKKKENPPLTPQESLEYLPEHFRGGRFETVWLEWWKLRKSERWTTRISYAKSSMKDLEKLAGGDVVLARKIVEQSMAKGWQGLFAVKGRKAPQGKNRYTSDTKLKYDKPKRNLEDA